MKILVAEDDESSYIYLATALKGIVSELLKADTGTEAVELCKSHPDTDLILMDIKMPLLDGYEATEKIREFNQKVVIIAQTAYALMGDKEKAMAAGCNDYVAKPIDRTMLIRLINGHIAGRNTKVIR
ncbi:MAG: response regulator [Bacteroidales bacterium]|nr:response regulator [Bacteroidales bacterium]